MNIPHFLRGLFSPRTQVTAPPSTPDGTSEDWWGESWMWVPGDLDEIEEGDR
ncbi:hypothetical protein [Streptomyces albipurpureus]|uniref:Uncharacterized protein n=1 Tax=Streptomyces albipurpureus TaxID=2897419 RepID=A0ABT0UVL5_9ACTN|nr:hypothetical protein [Streptomyces sp. CWNU-1]MCM2392505.1 hypothetical protein [Streptomyces sp. CWNU-1]